jgi:Transposase DDE domain group 1
VKTLFQSADHCARRQRFLSRRDYGLVRNLAASGLLLSGLGAQIDEKFARVRESAILCGGVARGFTEFQYQTLKSWIRSRRVIARAEVLQDKDNPRFIVTNLPAKGFDRDPDSLDRFGTRDDMENQIKQQYLQLEADLTLRPATTDLLLKHCAESSKKKMQYGPRLSSAVGRGPDRIIAAQGGGISVQGSDKSPTGASP